MTITCKTCGKRFDEKGNKEEENVNFNYYDLINHTGLTQHHTYKIQGLNMELNVG
jgi:hypothetical protein